MTILAIVFTSTSKHYLVRFCSAIALLSVAVVSGCGPSEPDNIVHLSGNVTFQGKPLPLGMIVFEPNPAKGNKGPQGHADIKDGKFDTRISKKGTVKGQIIARITGGDGVSPEPFTPFGNLLFEEFTTHLEVAENPKELSLEVPSSRGKIGSK